MFELAASHDKPFTQDPWVGPWVTVIRRNPGFAQSYADGHAHRYALLVTGMSRLLFDRDIVPGLDPEDLMLLDIPALVVPGDDTSHAPSVVQYLVECLPRGALGRSGDRADRRHRPERILDFLAMV